MRWSQLQKMIYQTWEDKLPLQIHSNAYSLSGGAKVGRYWITLGKDIIWDVPKDFPEECAKGTYNPVASEITAVIRQYLDTSREELLSREFPEDRWGVVEIFRVADRRLGRKKLAKLADQDLATPARKILEFRLNLKDAPPEVRS